MEKLLYGWVYFGEARPSSNRICSLREERKHSKAWRYKQKKVVEEDGATEGCIYCVGRLEVNRDGTNVGADSPHDEENCQEKKGKEQGPVKIITVHEKSSFQKARQSQ
jgi:hypothetical protein